MHVATNVISWTHHWSTKSLDLNLHISQNSLHMISSRFVQAEASIQAATLCVFWEVTQERAMMILDHFPEESGSESYVVCFFFGWMGTCIFRLPHAQNEKRKTTTKNEDKAMLRRDLWDEQGMEGFFLEVVLPYLSLTYSWRPTNFPKSAWTIPKGNGRSMKSVQPSLEFRIYILLYIYA